MDPDDVAFFFGVRNGLALAALAWLVVAAVTAIGVLL